jgi:RimJ/RimL family protein N-acetyltransferase
MLMIGERAALGPLRRDLVPEYARWRNAMDTRGFLLDTGLYTDEAILAWVERESEVAGMHDPARTVFTVYDRRDEAPVGTCALIEIHYPLGRCRFGIGLGERRGEGIGTDATRLALRWAFEVLGLRNVMLEVSEENAGAIAAYERAGFKAIGRRRDAMAIGGRRSDSVLMDAVPADLT